MGEILILIYVIIGITYTVINGLVRRVDTEGDWLLPLSWIFLWPMYLSLLIFSRLKK